MASNINDNIDVTLPAEQTGGYAGKVLKTKFVETLTSLKSGLTVAKSEITALQDGGIDAEAVQDIIASTIESGDNITTAYNDTTGKLTISADLFAEELPITASRNLLSSDQQNILVNAGATDLTITILTEAVSGIQAGAVQGFFTSSTGKFVFAGVAITGTVPNQAANTGFELRYRGGDVWVWDSGSGAAGASTDSSSLPSLGRLRKATNQLKVGEINKVNVIIIGDYTQMNVTRTYDTVLKTPTNRAKTSFPNLLVTELARMSGLQVNNNFYFTGFETQDPAISQKHDTRNVLTGTWTRGTTGQRIFLGRPAITTVTGSKQVFTPYPIFGSEICDTVDLYYRINSEWGSVALSIDGGVTTLATRNLADTAYGTSSMVIKWTVSVPRGANVITLTADCTGGKTVPELIIHTKDMQTPSIEIISIAPYLDGTSQSVKDHIAPALPLLNPHLVITAVTPSMATGGVSNATATTNYNDIYNLISPYADVAHMISPPTMNGDNSTAWLAWSVLQSGHRDTVLTVAATQGVPVVDMWEQWGNGNWDMYSYNGYYTDMTSYSNIGNQDIATGLKALFEEVL